MSEKVLSLNHKAEVICAALGNIGISHVEFRTYTANNLPVFSVKATGNVGDGHVTVTAVQEGRNWTYMMQGPATADGDPGPTMGAELMRGAYRDVGCELLWLLAEHPGEGVLDLPLPADNSKVTLAA